MAKERLSKLQKWILEQTYRLNVLHDSSVVGTTNSVYHKFAVRGDPGWAGHSHAYRYFKPWILQNYYLLPTEYGEGKDRLKERNKAHVTVHRTIINMEDKGLIDVDWYRSYKMTNWVLTEKGKEIASKLLNVNETQIFGIE